MANRFIQGKFNPPGNFELVTRDGTGAFEGVQPNLVHIYRDQNFIWQPASGILKDAEVVSSGVSSPGAIIEDKSSTSTNPGDFHVLVLENHVEGIFLVHYTKDNSNVGNPWKPAQPFIVSRAATGEASFIQSNLGPSKNNFEAVVLEGSNLVHYYKDNSAPGNAWVPTAKITTTASSSGCIIQSNLGPQGSPGNFEVVVRQGSNLVHYWRDNSDPTGASYPWSPTPTAIISMTATSSACIIQSNLGAAKNNFEVIAVETTDTNAQNFVHYFRDNSDPTGASYPWSPVPTATITQTFRPSNSGAVCLIQSDLGLGPGNFEVVTFAFDQANYLLAHWWRDNSTDPVGGWQSGGSVVVFPPGSGESG